MTVDLIERIHSFQLFTESKAELLESKDKKSAEPQVDNWIWLDHANLDKNNPKARKISERNELVRMSHRNQHGAKEPGWAGLFYHYHEYAYA